MTSRLQSYSASLLGALFLAAAAPAAADFPIANTFEVESRPAVAFNDFSGETYVAYLERQTDIIGDPVELRVQRLDAAGLQIGTVLQPLGSGSHEALGRPAIAYGSGVILVAVPEYRNGMPERVISRFIAADGGVMVGPYFLFDDGLGYYDDGQLTDGNGSLQITYNVQRSEFAVSVMRTVSGNNGVWAQTIDTSGTLGPIKHLSNQGIHGQNSQDLEYADVETNPTGGRYLFVNDGFVRALHVLDADLNFVEAVGGLDWGLPTDGLNHRNIAFGRIEGRDLWMIVWADENNCRPGYTTCTDPLYQWTGVWGNYVDPLDPNTPNTAFPISKIDSHVVTKYIPTPRVGYNRDAETFYVAWREVPVLDPQNDESRSHIRGNRVDYFVPPGIPSIDIPLPYNNSVLTYVTGTCPPAGPCFSEQDPVFPDVAAAKGFGAIAAWHEKFATNPSDLDVHGSVLGPPVPGYDSQSSPLYLPNLEPPLEVTLVGATHDGESSCGATYEEPDVWFLFESPVSGTLIAATCGSNDLYGEDTGIDSVLSIHQPNGNQFPGACNDDYDEVGSPLPMACDAVDFGTKLDSVMTRHLLPGEAVLVRVSRYAGSYGGRFLLSYSFEEDPDSDGDGLGDPLDNCIFKPNPAQRDTDGDGIGNFCDPDLNNDCIVNVVDLGLFKSVFFTSDPHADFNGDGAVNSIDLGLMKTLFFSPPGPSGVPNVCTP